MVLPHGMIQSLPTHVIDWTKQLRILNDVADLITPELTIEEITTTIYANVNHLIDAFQFAVGIYNENEGYYRL